MKKAIRFVLAVTVFAVLLVSSCAAPTPPATVPTRRPTKTQFPIGTVDFLDMVDTAVPIPTRQVFAPVCEPCAEPAVVNTSPRETYCANGKPYQSVEVEPGASLEPLSSAPSLKCVNSGMKKNVNGSRLDVWTCTGEQLAPQKVKVTNPPCRMRQTLQSNSAQCQNGLAYDAVNHCCAPYADEAGSKIIKLNMGACQ